MRADRLLSIMLLLQMHKRMTASQLATRFNVSERTILRDMDVLSGAGIPVVAERGVGGGWALIEGFRTQLTGLRADELQSLFFARPPEVLADLGLKEASESAWLKLWASLGERARQQAEFVHQRILVDPRGWRDSSKALTALPKLIEALWQNCQARFEYENVLHESGERLVHPLGLVAKGSTWYLVARRDENIRTYRVSRIGHIVVEAEAADRPAEFDLAKYWEESNNRFRKQLPTVIATYLVNPQIMHWIRYKGWRVVEQVEEGDQIRVRIRFDSEEEVVQLALSHSTDIELIEPNSLREVVLTAATETAQIYASE